MDSGFSRVKTMAIRFQAPPHSDNTLFGTPPTHTQSMRLPPSQIYFPVNPQIMLPSIPNTTISCKVGCYEQTYEAHGRWSICHIQSKVPMWSFLGRRSSWVTSTSSRASERGALYLLNSQGSKM